jgi:hypothetical protein
MLKHMALLFLISSCALLRDEPSLSTMDKEKLLDAVKLTGEGRGRLTLGESQYVFGVDSVLNEGQDWILAVQIPLHGEEVMILRDLKESLPQDEETESFEERIGKELQSLKLHKKITGQKFISEMRTALRFILSPQWGKKRDCVAQQSGLLCELDGEKFIVSATEKELTIKKLFSEEMNLQIVAKNLTKSFFAQTNILLHSEGSESDKKKKSSFSMEFFW